MSSLPTEDATAQSACDPDQNVILIGLMGSGKTTVGKLLSKRLGREFFDSDIELVRATGVEISTIFEIEGEVAFRLRERNQLLNLCGKRAIVLATGGGAVVRADNRPMLRGQGSVVYLHASPETVHQRTRGQRGRPLLATGDPLATLRGLYQERDPWYRETAHYIVEVGNETPGAVVNNIVTLLGMDQP